MVGSKKIFFLSTLLSAFSHHSNARELFGVRDDLHFSMEARQANKDGSVPVYKNPNASIEDRINDLLPRMSLEEKVSQL
jgi:beta-glucosidase